MSLKRKTVLATMLSAVFALGACSDGKDGAQGPQGPQGPEAPKPPLVISSAQAQVLEWSYGDGTVNVTFALQNQDGENIETLDRVQLMSTVTDENGMLANTIDVTYQVGSDTSVGTLEHTGDGVYSLVMPQEGVSADSTGIGYVRPGWKSANDGIPRTKRIMFNESDNLAKVQTTDDAKCVACHGEFDAASGNSTWGWHQHHHGLDNDQNVVVVEACSVCHTDVQKENGGWANNTLAMFGHGKKFDADNGMAYSGHSALWSNYSMDMKRCSTCHMDDVVFTATINGCATCHTSLQDPDNGLAVDHSGFTDANCTACHNADGGFYYDHSNSSS
ncbi:hypothetical protein [Paraferrimonas sedimenticola]|uniref:Decaheme c-type cytochrome, OmcA/MtrC family n=1 Tax=Paraferrimonas sedimenticola TaxID=375674 RepID=A0AA37RWB8_9GAMM|nr:hypothetical protein [Paraferrimonas sedimenticola]GLP96529.1 hypothetical protein GCM10007895_18350 [Paraferrimonas sedimenticola]